MDNKLFEFINSIDREEWFKDFSEFGEFNEIAPEEEWNWLEHNNTYKPSRERLDNFFDVKEEDNIPACGEQCEIIKEFCYKED